MCLLEDVHVRGVVHRNVHVCCLHASWVVVHCLSLLLVRFTWRFVLIVVSLMPELVSWW